MNRVKDPADPRRCKGAAPDGQCMNEALEGQDYCPAHRGRYQVTEDHKKNLYLLTKSKYRQRLAELSEHEALMSLRDTIALLHMTIEERFNQVKTDADILSLCGPIEKLAATLERLINRASQMELRLNSVLAKPTLLSVGQSISEAIAEELKSSDVEDWVDIADRINLRIVESIARATNQQ